MALRLTSFIQTHEDFIDPKSVDLLLNEFFASKRESNDYMERWALPASRVVSMLASIPTEKILKDFYGLNYNVMSQEAFPAGNMNWIDPYNITIHRILDSKTFRHSTVSANHPAFFHHQLTGRIILFNPEERRMNFFFDPNTHSVSLPDGSLSIHPSNMLFPHRPDEGNGELIYLEFHLCPAMTKKGEQSESTIH